LVGVPDLRSVAGAIPAGVLVDDLSAINFKTPRKHGAVCIAFKDYFS